MIELIATAESLGQAEKLLENVDTLYIGEDEFGLRLPVSFSRAEQKEIIGLAHDAGRKVTVALNALLHNDRIQAVLPYLEFLAEAGADAVTIGDPGVIHLMAQHGIHLPYLYDAQTMVTSASQVNFWARRGAVGAVLARELTKEELLQIGRKAEVPVEVLVYGATCIHQSKRPLVQNYFNYVGESASGQERTLFLSEPKKEDTHYSIYEDRNGTHIFATNDVSLAGQLDVLNDGGLLRWKLDGLFTKGDAFVRIAEQFNEAKKLLEAGQWTMDAAAQLQKEIQLHHPVGRSLDEGFFVKNPEDIA